eukprot:gene43033-53405_t
MSNKFGALQDDSGSDSDVEDIVIEPTKLPSRQSGGDLIIRNDPLVGLKHQNSTVTNSLPVELGFNGDDLSACIRVIDALGKNPNLFKLAALKPLRASLHPLIVEQMKNYDTSSSKVGDKKKRKRGKDTDDDDQLRIDRHNKLEADYINQTQLRAIRLQQLELLNTTEGVEGAHIPRVPDGVALIKDG